MSIQPASGDDTTTVVVTPDRHDTLSDSFRTLRSVIGFVEGGTERSHEGAPILLVVSPGPSDGKTTVSSNLAAAFVETGSRTIAVNADFRRPSLTKRLTGEPAEALGFDLLRGRRDVTPVIRSPHRDSGPRDRRPCRHDREGPLAISPV